MSSRIIYMDGVATAHLRDDDSIRVELAAGHTRYDLGSSMAGVLAAIERKTSGSSVSLGQLSGPQLVGAPAISLEGGSTPSVMSDRAS